MFILVGDDDRPVRGDQLDAEQVVAAVAVSAGQPPDTAAQGRSADPGGIGWLAR